MKEHDQFNRTNASTRHLAVLVSLLVLAGCQTSGLLGSVGSDDAASKPDAGQQTAAAEPAPRGTNPNARTRLKNTRTALTDYCPSVRLRDGTEAYRVVPKGADQQDADKVQYQATIVSVARECSYVGENLEIKVGARGRVITGPAGKPGEFQVPVRVAVTEGGDTIYSKLYRPTATIPAGSASNRFSFVDQNVVIPAPRNTNVRIYIGFDPGPYKTP